MTVKKQIPPHLNRMCDAIASDIAALNVDILARKTGISKKSLNFSCKKHLGRTPKQILDEYRLFKCLVILGRDKTAVLDIALILGYNNPETLHRAIKGRYGISPVQLRRQIRAMSEDDRIQVIAEVFSEVTLFKFSKAISP